ncbi:hypothetical protein GCM10010274_07940 [Streptomyces lavendofoliae]|uniref:Uncharacterized protein n=1 Tax=Streptomyces lavendofoliae TaxID=67314 RepID=A0A918HV36_9ACTN|nr:hypothetical protein GCM10010274_07940 [Streptomyces lavendofoliae]
MAAPASGGTPSGVEPQAPPFLRTAAAHAWCCPTRTPGSRSPLQSPFDPSEQGGQRRERGGARGDRPGAGAVRPGVFFIDSGDRHWAWDCDHGQVRPLRRLFGVSVRSVGAVAGGFPEPPPQRIRTRTDVRRLRGQA